MAKDPNNQSDKNDKPIRRRAFFRAGLGELLKPLANAIAPVERTLDELAKLDGQGSVAGTSGAKPQAAAPRPDPLANVWLRPPGAIAEKQFRETCSRCNACVEVCPAQCIKIDPTGFKGNGAPYIDADAMPCVLCNGLQCMQSCPSGALVPVPLVQINMGTAVWKEEHCVRTKGENCTICVDQCPIGTKAIELSPHGEVNVHPNGCVGCGVCQNYCPTTPKSIVVIPIAARQR
jgi:ferredoxin-type protein NapG